MVETKVRCANPVCVTEFVPTHGKQKFCTPSCGRADWKTHRGGAQKVRETNAKAKAKRLSTPAGKKAALEASARAYTSGKFNPLWLVR